MTASDLFVGALIGLVAIAAICGICWGIGSHRRDKKERAYVAAHTGETFEEVMRRQAALRKALARQRETARKANAARFDN
jgi:hypothetical protein